MARKRRINRERRNSGNLAWRPLGAEWLENRRLLSASPASLGDAVGRISWNGSETVAYRDSYLVEMPTTKVAKPSGYFDYVSTAPDIPTGWSAQSVGLGYYSVLAPGASEQQVAGWAAAVGAASIEPNQVLVKQAVPTAVPNDSAYVQYLWGLNNTGTLGTTLSPESSAAAARGNGPDIFPRTRDADIDAPEAWAIQTGTRQIIVAVFDDGIDDTHPDLARNMWTRPANVPATWSPTPGRVEPFVGRHGFNSAEWMNPANGVDPAPNNGIAPGVNAFYEGSTVAPYNDSRFVSTRPGDIRLFQRKLVWVPDAQGRLVQRQYVSWRGANNAHGTHVAGIIGAAGNNALGVTGVNWATSLYSANIFRYGDFDPDGHWRAADQTGQTGSMAAFLDAVNRIKTLKEDYGQNFVVANLSFNTLTRSLAMQSALGVLDRLGMLLVVSAGNGYDAQYQDGVGDNIGTEPWPLNDWDTYPALYRDSFPNSMIVVTSSTAQDTLPRFANWGANVDIAAPGENIWSTVPLSARQYQPGLNGLLGGSTSTDIPTQYDSFEPFYLSPMDPQHWGPNGEAPSGDRVEFTEIDPVTLRPGVNPLDAVWPTDFIEQDYVVSRPLMFREVPRPMQQAPLGSAPGSQAYASMSGTSMSTAYVSGVAALMASEFYRWTEAVPSALYLKQGIITQADVISTLVYQEGDNEPPHDYQHLDKSGSPIARTGMYERATDPESRLHRIGGGSFTGVNGTPIAIPNDLRLNAYKGVDWVRSNLPPSVSVIPRPETDETLGESRLEGDPGDPTNTPAGGNLYELLYSAKFNAGTGVFAAITLPPVPVRVQVWTQDIVGSATSATAGVDYVPIPRGSPVTFTIAVQPAGTTIYDIPARDFKIDVITDAIAESNEAFYLNLRVVADSTNMQSVWCKTRLFADAIIDDDPTNAKPLVSVATKALSITEGNGGIRKPTQGFVTIGLDRVARRAVLVPYRTAQLRSPTNPNELAFEGVDYLGASLTARIPAGQSSVRVPVYVIGDPATDRNQVTSPIVDERFRVVIGAPNLGVRKRGGTSSEITIRDDDSGVVDPPPEGAPSLTMAPPAVPVPEGSPAVFGLTLSGPVPAGGRVAVTYTTLDGTAKAGQDYVRPATPRTVTIPAGSVASQIVVSTLADQRVEPSETFSVQIIRATLTRANGTTVALPIVGSTTRSATIADGNTPPGLPTFFITGPVGPVTEGEVAAFTVGLSSAVPQGYAVAFYYSVSSGTATINSDFAGPASGSVVVPAGETTGTIRVQTRADLLVESDETFVVQVTRAVLFRVGSSTTQSLTFLGSPIASATIADATPRAMSRVVLGSDFTG